MPAKRTVETIQPFAEFVAAGDESGKRIVILPRLRIVVVETEPGQCAIMPLESKGIGDGGAEVMGNVGEVADKLSRAGG